MAGGSARSWSSGGRASRTTSRDRTRTATASGSSAANTDETHPDEPEDDEAPSPAAVLSSPARVVWTTTRDAPPAAPGAQSTVPATSVGCRTTTVEGTAPQKSLVVGGTTRSEPCAATAPPRPAPFCAAPRSAATVVRRRRVSGGDHRDDDLLAPRPRGRIDDAGGIELGQR